MQSMMGDSLHYRNVTSVFQYHPDLVAFQVDQCPGDKEFQECLEDHSGKTTRAYHAIDFSDIDFKGDSASRIVLRLYVSRKLVKHTLPIIDRCCRLNGRKISYDGVDDIKRISCDISKEEFLKVSL